MRDRNHLEGSAAKSEGATAFYVAEGHRLLRFFRRRIGKGDEAADLVQETFARYVGYPAKERLLNPAAYLQRIARNLLIDRSRRHHAAPPMINIDDADPGVRSDQADAIEAAQLMAAYERAVDGLPPRSREVFLLHRVAELRYEEIATRLGISIRTVEWHMSEALLRMRRSLDGR